MPAVVVKWHDRAFTRRLRRHLGDNLEAADIQLVAYIRALITQTRGSYSPPNHSQPGDVPFVITHEVERSFDYWVNKAALQSAVFSDDEVARFLESGTARMAPRPYFERSLVAIKGNLARTLCKPM